MSKWVGGPYQETLEDTGCVEVKIDRNDGWLEVFVAGPDLNLDREAMKRLGEHLFNEIERWTKRAESESESDEV